MSDDVDCWGKDWMIKKLMKYKKCVRLFVVSLGLPVVLISVKSGSITSVILYSQEWHLHVHENYAVSMWMSFYTEVSGIIFKFILSIEWSWNEH